VFRLRKHFHITSITCSAVSESGAFKIECDDFRPALDAWEVLKEECLISFFLSCADAAVGTGLSSVSCDFKLDFVDHYLL
jgi:hypothetical protein